MEVCGKFRGVVVDNVDPLAIGRLQVNVPDAGGGITAFALPCLPFAGNDVGFFAPPPVGANVWVEFEAGDVNRPIWTGCFWGAGEAPPDVALQNTKFLRVEGVSLVFDDATGAITMEVPAHGVRIQLDVNGVQLEHQGATIRASGGTVSINEGALVVQ